MEQKNTQKKKKKRKRNGRRVFFMILEKGCTHRISKSGNLDDGTAAKVPRKSLGINGSTHEDLSDSQA